MYMKFGRRPVMIATLVIFVAALAGCAGAKTYPQLMALRVLQSFGSGVCEALPVQLVNEIVILINISETHRSFSSMNGQIVSVSTPWLCVLVRLGPCTPDTYSTPDTRGACSSGC